MSSVTGERGARLCVLVGTRGEGERCEEVPSRAGAGCRADLLCNLPFCGRPCRRDEPTSCPAGFTCRSGRAGDACTANCEQTGCPEGETCLSFGEAQSPGAWWACSKLVGENCETTGCPAGQSCQSMYHPGSGQVAMRCLPDCDADGRCPTGFICDDGTCLARCRSELDCPDAMTCIEVNRDKFIHACVLYPLSRKEPETSTPDGGR